MKEKFRPAPTPEQQAVLDKFKQAQESGEALMIVGDEATEQLSPFSDRKTYRTTFDNTLAAYGYAKLPQDKRHAHPRTRAWYRLLTEASSGAARKRWGEARETYRNPLVLAVNVLMALRYHCRAVRFYLAGCFAPSGV